MTDQTRTRSTRFFRRSTGYAVAAACLAFAVGFAERLVPRWDWLRTEDQVMAIVALLASAAAAWLAWGWGRRT